MGENRQETYRSDQTVHIATHIRVDDLDIMAQGNDLLFHSGLVDRAPDSKDM